MRLINLYSHFLSYMRYFLFFVYLLVIKFPVILELIIIFSVFPLILIFMCNWAILVEAAFLLAGAVPQYFFWLLPSGESSSFSIFSEDIFFGYIWGCLSKISYISYICSEFCSYPLYKITIIFIYSLWSGFLILKVFSNSLLWSRVFLKNTNNIFY